MTVNELGKVKDKVKHKRETHEKQLRRKDDKLNELDRRPLCYLSSIKTDRFRLPVSDDHGAGQFVMPALFLFIYANPDQT